MNTRATVGDTVQFDIMGEEHRGVVETIAVRDANGHEFNITDPSRCEFQRVAGTQAYDPLTSPLALGDLVELIADDPLSTQQLAVGTHGEVTWVTPEDDDELVKTDPYYGGAAVRFPYLIDHLTLLRPRSCLRIIARKVMVPIAHLAEIEGALLEHDERVRS